MSVPFQLHLSHNISQQCFCNSQLRSDILLCSLSLRVTSLIRCRNGPLPPKLFFAKRLGVWGVFLVLMRSGAECEKEIDECALITCHNAGQCITSQSGHAATCLCIPGFTGMWPASYSKKYFCFLTFFAR